MADLFKYVRGVMYQQWAFILYQLQYKNRSVMEFGVGGSP